MLCCNPRWALAILWLGLIVQAPAQIHHQSPEKAIEALNECAVMIHMREGANGRDEDRRTLWCGTGTLIRGSRYLITNMHVGSRDLVREFSSAGTSRFDIDFFSRGGEIEVGVTQRENQKQDVTAFHVRSSPADGIDRYVRFRDLEVGMPLFTLGNSMCNEWTYGAGALVALPDKNSGDKEQRDFLEAISEIMRTQNVVELDEDYERLIIATGSLATSGNSGGPVVDSFGRLVGIVWAKDLQYIYIIPVEYVYGTLGWGEPATADIPLNSTHPANRQNISSSNASEAAMSTSRQDTPVAENYTARLTRFRPLNPGTKLYEALYENLMGEDSTEDPITIIEIMESPGHLVPVKQIIVSGGREKRLPVYWWNPNEFEYEDHSDKAIFARVASGKGERSFLVLPPDTDAADEITQIRMIFDESGEIISWPEKEN